MRVVDVTSFFSDSCGGIKTYYRAKARLLPARGLDCHFVVPGDARRDEPFEGGTLHRLPGPRLARTHYRCFGDPGALRELLGDLRPDVIEIGSHYLLPALVQHALRGIQPAPRLVGFYHADYPDTYVGPALRHAPTALARAAVELAWKFCRHQHVRYDATLAASRFVVRTLGARGVPRVHWVGLGVDVEVFHPDAGVRGGDVPTVVYAGRLAPEKGFAQILSAWDAIHRRTGARLVVVGDGPLAGDLRAFAASRPHVAWRGYLDDARAVAGVLASADVVLAPGAHESFSLATAEALACATPVVGADRGGNAELVDVSGGGLTYRAGRVDTLIAGTVGLLGLPEATRLELGAAGRAHVTRALTWDHVAGRICDVYAGLGGVSLLASIHDVAPGHLATVQRLRDALLAWGAARATLLAVPDYHRQGRLVGSRATVAWLRARADAGDEVCLHGHFHVQPRRPPAALGRLRARLWTAGEGECLAQDDEERRRMLHDERRALEDALGRAVTGFVAPAWLEPPGFGAALAAAGFAWHESGMWVERLGAAPRRWHAPVIGFATRTTARRVASLAWAYALTPSAVGLARRGVAPARVALHPDDAQSPAVLAAAEATVRRLAPLGAETYATALRISATRRDVHAAL